MISSNSSSTSTITFPTSSNTIYGVSSMCVANSPYITTIDFSSSATNICDGAFTYLSNLTRVLNASNILFTDEITMKSETDNWAPDADSN
jgi:hypothetical protein